MPDIRKYIVSYLCMCFCIWFIAPMSFVSCSTSFPLETAEETITPEKKNDVSLDASEYIPIPEIQPEARTYSDAPCYDCVTPTEPEPYRKRTGSWAIGPRTLAPYAKWSVVSDLVVDSKDNVLMTVLIEEAFFIIKVGPDSVPLWIYKPSTLPGEGRSSASNILCDAQDNIYILGSFTKTLTLGMKTLTAPKNNTHLFILKLNSTGQPLWSRQLRGEGFGFKITLNSQGDIYIAGGILNNNNLFDDISLPEQPEQINLLVVGKLDAQGKWLWFRTVHAPKIQPYYYDAYIAEVTLDPNENFYIIGSYISRVQFGTLSLSTKQPFAQSDYDIFVAKYNKDGALQWATSAGSDKRDVVESSIVDQKGNLYFSGHLHSTFRFGSFTLSPSPNSSIFVAKVTSEGTFEWAVQGGSKTYSAFCHKLHQAPNGSILITGVVLDGQGIFGTHHYSPETRVGISSIFKAQLDTKGQWLSVTHLNEYLGMDYGSHTTHPQFDSHGNLYVGGRFVYTARFGSTILEQNVVYDQPQGSSMLFLWKIFNP